MPKYDAENSDPPAPVAYVTLPDPATGVSLSKAPLLKDTGADVTLRHEAMWIQWALSQQLT